MRRLQLLSTTAAILLLGVCAVSAQTMKTNETTGAPAAQQNAPPEKMAPALKPDQSKAPDKIGQAAPVAPKSDKLLTTDKGASTGAVAEGTSDADRGVNTKSERTANNGIDVVSGRSGRMDRYTTATEAIAATADVEITVIAGTLGLWC